MFNQMYGSDDGYDAAKTKLQDADQLYWKYTKKQYADKNRLNAYPPVKGFVAYLHKALITDQASPA